MSVNLGLPIQGSSKLIKKISIFNSPHIDGYKLVNTKYYDSGKLTRRPRIESVQFIKTKDETETASLIANKESSVLGEYNGKSFENSSKFEIYKLHEDVIKLIKDRFGTIIAFKTNVKNSKLNNDRLYDNFKTALNGMTRNFLQ